MNVAGCSGRRGQAEEQGPMGRTQERPRARKPRGQGHERVEEILAAAKALYAEGGYEFTPTRRIAGRVGVSQTDRRRTRLTSSHQCASRMPSSACNKNDEEPSHRRQSLIAPA